MTGHADQPQANLWLAGYSNIKCQPFSSYFEISFWGSVHKTCKYLCVSYKSLHTYFLS